LKKEIPVTKIGNSGRENAQKSSVLLYNGSFTQQFWIDTMARKPTRAPAKPKTPAAVETSESIAEQTAAFLKRGNEIDKVKSGISGQPSMAAKKQIKIGNR
jgi:hypothetical protein